MRSPLSLRAHPADLRHLNSNCKNMLQTLYCCVKFSYIRLKLNEVYGHGKQRRKSWLHWVCWNLERPFGNVGLRYRSSYRIPHRSRHSLSNRFDVISSSAYNSWNSGDRPHHKFTHPPANKSPSLHTEGDECIFYPKIPLRAQTKIFSVSIFIARLTPGN